MNSIGSVSLIQQMQEMASLANGIENKNPVEGIGKENFSSLFKDALNSVNDIQTKASDLKKGYEIGDPGINITQVMIASQKSEISFQALLQVRNKLLSAYQEVMRMQI